MKTLDGYIFVSNESSKYIGMDNASGGYPYETDNILSVHLWKNLHEALKYHSIFKDKRWTLCRLTYRVDEVILTESDLR